MTKHGFKVMRDKLKKFILIFLIIQIVFGSTLTILFSSAVSGMVNTIGTIRFPFSLIKKEYNASNPWVEYSFFVRNENEFELVTFQADISIDILYVNKSSGSLVRSSIYKKTSMYYNIPSKENLYYLINGTSESFQMINLVNFWLFVDVNKTVSSLIHAFFRGHYLGGLVSFNLGIFNQNMSKFEI